MNEKDAQYVVDWIGGVPWMIERILANREDLKRALENLYLQSRSRLYAYLDEKIEKGEDEEIFKKVLEQVLRGEMPKDSEGIKEMKRLVEREVLFFDPVRREIRFQTKLDERAAREILEVI